MLIINSDELKQALTMPAALQAVEEAYGFLGAGTAVNRPRTDSWASIDGGRLFYILKSMDGVVPGMLLSAVRVNSNLVEWRRYAGSLVKASATGKYVGLVVLFSLTDGQPLALFPDEYVQAMRVGATCGLAIKYLAKDDVRKVAIIGSGRQAKAAIEALLCVRRPEEVAVYSPDPDRRSAFAGRFTGRGPRVWAAESAEAAVEGADMILVATSSLLPICRPEWVQPGRFISTVKSAEVGAEARARADRIVVNCRAGAPINYLPGREAFAAHNPLAELGALEDLAGQGTGEPDWGGYPELAEVIRDAPPRDSAKSVLFVNNIGLGIQFVAIGSVVYARARELGLGTEVAL
jgi:alanine dehydrogenase